jgi:Sap-like sulfolipid-1-addressing protein
MNLEALVLGLFSGVRPGTSLAAVLVLLKTPQPQRPLLFFTAAGFASSWLIGLLVVGVFHGANVAVGGSTFTAVLDVAFGAAALGFAAGLQRGWVQPRRRRGSSPSASAASSRFGERLRNPSAGVAAAAGVGTHLPGLIYLVALNAIASQRPALIDASLQVAIYDALWFLVPLASLVRVVVRPGAALGYLEAATAWVRRHEHAVLVAGSLVLGGYLVVKGTASLLT